MEYARMRKCISTPIIRKVSSRKRVSVFCFKKGGIVTTDTYFNSLTIEKWAKYTKVSKVRLTLSLQGKFNVSLCWKQKISERYVERELKNITVDADNRTQIMLEYPEETRGMFYFRIEAIEKGGKFFGGYYATEIQEEEIRPVKLGIVICTYKRENMYAIISG